MAADEQSTDLIPLLGENDPQFDLVMRGYDRRQVEEYVARTEADLADLQAAKDAALAISADRAAQLANREAHIESLKRQAIKSTENINPANVSDRIRDMLQLATDEAAQTRRTAEEEAERVLSAAKADAERVRADAAAEQQRLTAGASQRSAEADQKLAQARVQAAAEIETARAEIKRFAEVADADRLAKDKAASEVRAEADRISAERRRTAEEDFEITLRARRTATEHEARLGQDEAKALAAQIVADARAELAALKVQQDETHRALRELHAALGSIITSHVKGSDQP
jgi:cell division septum initiation protein DivIVA